MSDPVEALYEWVREHGAAKKPLLYVCTLEEMRFIDFRYQVVGKRVSSGVTIAVLGLPVQFALYEVSSRRYTSVSDDYAQIIRDAIKRSMYEDIYGGRRDRPFYRRNPWEKK